MSKRNRVYPNLKAFLDDYCRDGGTQGDFAASMGMSEGYLSDLKQGKVQPSLTLAARLAKDCNIPIESFLSSEISQ